MKVIHVAVGVVKRDNTLFICKRADEQHQGGLWEFPGGKVELGETADAALARELKEEIDITVINCFPLMQIKHDYTDKSVLLDIYVVDTFEGTAKGNEGQDNCWVDLQDINKYKFPEANKPILEALKSII